MKTISIIISIICLSGFLFLVSCSSIEVTTSPETTNNLATTNNSDLRFINDELRKVNKELEYENSTLKNKIEYLENNLEIDSISPLLGNYHIDDILQIIYTENSNVDIFPGILQSIHIETINEVIYFIFYIDRMAVNPNWDGPGSDGDNGYFINNEEKYQEYRGNLNTVFAAFGCKGYLSYQEKQEAILTEYGDSGIFGDKGVYNFYMVGDEIVYVGADPGP